jgi:hypothetical protein
MLHHDDNVDILLQSYQHSPKHLHHPKHRPQSFVSTSPLLNISVVFYGEMDKLGNKIAFPQSFLRLAGDCCKEDRNAFLRFHWTARNTSLQQTMTS